MADKYDIVIVGAGPAGSLAARCAANKGAKVLLLERDPVIGTPVRCGEGITERGIMRFVDIQPRWVAAQIKGFYMYAPNGVGVKVMTRQEMGYVLERVLFDRYLAELAAEAGADILTRADVDGLVLEDGFVKGVRYNRFGREYSVKCAVTIGADGVESRVAHWAGLFNPLKIADLISAYQFYLAGVEYDYNYCHLYFGQDAAPGGYIWMFPKSGSVVSAGIGINASHSDAGMAYRKLREFVSRRFRKAAIVGEMAGAVPVALPMKKPYGNGILLAGDTARHCNPLTGGGIYTAMCAGSAAGEVAAEACQAGDVSEKRLKDYLRRIDDDIMKTNQRAYRIRMGIEKLDDATLNEVAVELNSMGMESLSLRRVFLQALVNQPSLAIDVIKAFV
ncbi:MAG: NAD(P)/FAD-dependent oxidoreductase [Calditrichaeota bacterium]|nr:NAD(P)/FAD-dependent oxidoreductase [Calditrichota bacterium]